MITSPARSPHGNCGGGDLYTHDVCNTYEMSNDVNWLFFCVFLRRKCLVKKWESGN